MSKLLVSPAADRDLDSIPMFWLTSGMTLFGMAVTSRIWKDTPSARADTEAFFRHLKKEAEGLVRPNGGVGVVE